MRSFIDDVHAGKRDALIVSNALNVEPSDSQKIEAWQKLQHELIDVGIAPELSRHSSKISGKPVDNGVSVHSTAYVLVEANTVSSRSSSLAAWLTCEVDRRVEL